MSERIKVLVVDDQQVMRDGLVALLALLDDVEVVGDAADGAQALEMIETNAVDIVLMDLRMPVLDGAEATKRIVADHEGVGVLVLTTYSDDQSIGEALRAGARGYLTKDAGRAEIAAAIRAAAAGQSTFDPAVARRLAASFSEGSKPSHGEPPAGLTARETEILGLIAEGLSNAQIAKTLFVGESTVKTHINNAFAKIHVSNRTEAARYAFEHALANRP